MSVFIVAVLTLIIAALIGMVANWIPRPDTLTPRVAVGAISALVILGAAVAVIGAGATSRDILTSPSTPATTSIHADSNPSTPDLQPNTSTTSIVTTAEAAQVLYLAEMEPVGTDHISFGRTPATVNGQACTQPINVARNPGGRASLDYDLGRRFALLKVQVGLRDDSDSQSRQRFEVLGDGTMLAQADVGLGEIRSLTIPIAGKLRLRLTVTTINRDYHPAVATWCDPHVST